MSSPNGQSTRCQVLDGDKLPAQSGGPRALCEAIERAVSQKVPRAAFSVEVRVLSPTRLAATLTVEGRKLPEQNFASMDRQLDGGSFGRFAAAIADQAAKARR
jgi:hypothetical protein